MAWGEARPANGNGNGNGNRGAGPMMGGNAGQNARAQQSLLAYIAQLTGLGGKQAQQQLGNIMQNSPGMSMLQLDRAMANNPREMTPGAVPQRVGPGRQLGGNNVVSPGFGPLGGVHAGPGGGGGGGQGGGPGGGAGGGRGGGGGNGGGGGGGLDNGGHVRFESPGLPVTNWQPQPFSWETWGNIPHVASPSAANPMGTIGQYLGQQYGGAAANAYGPNANGGGGIPWDRLYSNKGNAR